MSPFLKAEAPHPASRFSLLKQQEAAPRRARF
jgi:hypothetical protein